MDKFELEYRSFCENCLLLKDKKLVLYGTGRMTATLLEKNRDFQIVGLCDREPEKIGETLYGLPILSERQAEETGDVVVINTAPAYWHTIFSRIRHWKLPIYYKNGQRAIEHETDIDKNPYWNVTEKKLTEQIAAHNVISFDIFGTLVLRAYCSDSDLFRILDRLTEEIFPGFSEKRKRAGTMAGSDADIHEIYKWMEVEYGLSHASCERLKQLEYETDCSYMVPRKVMVDICNATMKDKKVIFVSDMYYTREQVWEILRRIGVHTDIEAVFVSSNVKRSKRTGEIWETVKERAQDGSVLHIGDHTMDDVVTPQSYDIDSFGIMNTWAMTEASAIGGLCKNVGSLYSSVGLGVVVARLFNSPFALAETRGRLGGCDLWNIGYGLFGLFAYTFADWLIEVSLRENIPELCFFTRESWFLIKQFEKLCLLRGINSIRALELNISRRAIMNAAIRNRNDIEDVLDFPYKGTVSELLHHRFNVETTEEDRREYEAIIKNKSDRSRLIDKYEKSILEEAERQRKNYLAYVDSLNLSRPITIVDSFIYGSTQYYLSRLLNEHTRGFYMLINKEKDNRCLDVNEVYSCFQDEGDITGKNNEIYEYSLLLEALYTAPYGMIREVLPDGKVAYEEPRANQRNFKIREKIQDGISCFFEDFYKRIQILDIERDVEFTRKMFGVFVKSGMDENEELEAGFYYDNGVLTKEEHKLFEISENRGGGASA